MAVMLRSRTLPSHIWCCGMDDGRDAVARRRTARHWERRQWQAEVDEEIADGNWLPDDPWEKSGYEYW